MGVIMKTVLSVLLILILAFTSISSIGASNEAEAADSYLQECSAELQICNFNDAVFTQIQQEAASYGYVLSMETTKDSYGDVQYAVLTMDYTYSMPIVGLESTHTLRLVSR